MNRVLEGTLNRTCSNAYESSKMVKGVFTIGTVASGPVRTIFLRQVLCQPEVAINF